MQAPNWTDFLNCSVCMSKFNPQTVVPVSLACCHTICKRCLSRLKMNTCPYDRTPIPSSTSNYPPNTSLLSLLGFQNSDWSQEMSKVCPSVVPESDLNNFIKGHESMERLAVFLKPFVDQGVLQATASIPRPVLKKLVTLLNCQIVDYDGRSKALRAAHSIAERVITELLIMHQNPQQIPTLLWAAVRNRGCQFLGPIMQEEALRLILKVLESGRHLSRKNIVLYVVHQLQTDFPNASKTNIGHVVQLLYRASCFNVEKREDESSLMQLKEEFRTYESLRREHDAQIVRIAMEAGLRITPETWSTQLYGNANRKSEMQSIIDKLVSQGITASGLSELIVAIGRSQDPHGLSEKLIPHLDALLKIVVPPERLAEEPTPSPQQDMVGYSGSFLMANWTVFSQGIEELIQSLQAFTDFSQVHYKDRSDTHVQTQSGKYKTGICPYLSKPGGCPRGHLCPYAHSEEEKRKFVNIAKINRRPNIITGSGVPQQGGVSGAVKSPVTQPSSFPMAQSTSRVGGVPRAPPIRQPSDELMGSPYSSLEEANGYGSFPGGTVMYPTDPRVAPAFIVHQNIPMLSVNSGGSASGGYHAHSEGYSVSQGMYPSYEQGDSGNGLNPTSLDNNYTRADNVSYYPMNTDSTTTPTTSVSESWTYKKPESHARITTPTSTDSNSKEEYQLTSSMDHMKLSDDQVRDKKHGDHTHQHGSAQNPVNEDIVGKLNAHILDLKAELEEMRRKPNNHRSGEIMEPYYHPGNYGATPPSNYGVTPPGNYGVTPPGNYGGTPHSGELMRSVPANYVGPPPQQYHQTTPIPVETGFYHPLYGGLPGHIPGHPWSGQLGPVVVSPHTTPPNTQLLLAAPTQPPPPSIHQRPVPMLSQDQIESDAMIAHFIQFAEQSKAQRYPIAPGSHLSHAPILHPSPVPHYHHNVAYRHPQPIGGGKRIYK